MDKFMNRLTEGVRGGSTRRGFLSTAGKVAAGAAAAVAAGGVGVAEAAPQCCSGARTCYTSGTCPSGDTEQPGYLCCYNTYGHNEYICYDCITPAGFYDCTYATGPTPNCPQSPARLRTAVQ